MHALVPQPQPQPQPTITADTPHIGNGRDEFERVDAVSPVHTVHHGPARALQSIAHGQKGLGVIDAGLFLVVAVVVFDKGNALLGKKLCVQVLKAKAEWRLDEGVGWGGVRPSVVAHLPFQPPHVTYECAVYMPRLMLRSPSHCTSGLRLPEGNSAGSTWRRLFASLRVGSRGVD